MVRNYKRKSTKGTTSSNVIANVIQAVQCGETVRGASRIYGLDRMTLTRYIKRQRENPNVQLKPTYKHRVFTNEEEDALTEYLIFSSKLNFGLSKKMTCQLAYEFAKKNNKQVRLLKFQIISYYFFIKRKLNYFTITF